MQLDEALALSAPPETTSSPPNVPAGWEPGVRWSNATDSGTITTGNLDREPDKALWDEIVKDWQFDPELLEIIDGSIELIGWDSPIKGTDQSQRLRRYKAKFRKRVRGGERADVDALCRMVEKRKARKTHPIDTAERALVVVCSDWQIGKGEGDGSTGTVERISASMDAVVDRLRELRKVGRGVEVVYLVGLGDLVEQCSGHYAAQQFTTDLNRREQMRVVRRLLLMFVDAICADHAVVLTGVAGNHGENRGAAGKAYTTPDDNDDLAVIEQVAEILGSNPQRYGHVSTFLPSELSMCLSIAGVLIGFYHGHIGGKGGANPQAKMQNWWTGQIVGIQPVAPAKILVTGHYHHLTLSESTGRTHMQAPAMDPGSAWFTTSTGQSSPAGMLTFVAGTACGLRGWDDLKVL